MKRAFLIAFALFEVLLFTCLSAPNHLDVAYPFGLKLEKENPPKNDYVLKKISTDSSKDQFEYLRIDVQKYGQHLTGFSKLILEFRQKNHF